MGRGRGGKGAVAGSREFWGGLEDFRLWGLEASGLLGGLSSKGGTSFRFWTSV